MTTLDQRSPAAARRSSWLGWWLSVGVWVGAPFALVLAAAAAVFLWWKLAEAKAAHEVNLEVARIQAAGEPVTIYDLYQYHQVPPGTTDTTALWVQAFRLYELPQYGMDCRPLPIVGKGDYHQGLDPASPGNQIAESAAFLKKHDAIVQATLAAARAGEECRLPTDFASGAAGILPSVQQRRSLARTMSLRMRVSLAQDDVDAAIESVAASLATVRAQQHQLSLVEQLVRIAILGVALSDARDLVASGKLSDDELARLQREVQSLEIQNSFTTSLLGERGVGFHSFHQFPPLPAGKLATATQADPMAGGRLTRATACKIHLQMMQGLIDASHQPRPQALAAGRSVGTATQSANPLERGNYALSQQFLPSAHAAFQARARIEAQREVTLAAIAAERYRLRHGELPPNLTALDEFLPSVPIDPYDGQPLSFKDEGEEIVIYSICRDKIEWRQRKRRSE